MEITITLNAEQIEALKAGARIVMIEETEEVGTIEHEIEEDQIKVSE